MSPQTPKNHILSDLNVLDLSRVLAGPTCTRLLAEMGANVVKVEAAPNGDMTRNFSKFRADRSLYFVQQNRGKKGLCLNFRDPRGLALLTELVPHFDVVVENFRPGTLDAMGLGYERLKMLKPDIILASISALGQEGELAEKSGYDYIAQAYSGVTSMIGEPDDAPYIPQVGFGDISTGVHAALAIVSAIHYRQRTGEGQHVDTSLLDVYYNYHEINVHTYAASDGAIAPTRAGRHMTYACPAGVFRTREGCVVILALGNHWKDLCLAMEREDLIEHPDWATDNKRLERLDEVTKLIEDWLTEFASTAAAVTHLERFDVPVAPVLSVADTVDHPLFRESGTVRTVEDPLHGELDIPGVPIRFSGFPEPLTLVAPTLGQHNEVVLKEYLGRSADEIQALRDDGVLVEREI
jgi:CoA:oxalate CoA-transferase